MYLPWMTTNLGRANHWRLKDMEDSRLAMVSQKCVNYMKRKRRNLAVRIE
jgi:hypothetical protein